MFDPRQNILSERKASYKAPPSSLRSASSSQENRRQKALEEQKRRRAERFDSSRQLDFFADLNLGPSDDEANEGDGLAESPNIVREGVSQFAALLPSADSHANASDDASADISLSPPLVPDDFAPPEQDHSKKTNGKKRGKKRRSKARSPTKPQASSQKPTRWADKCMYAELLEMTEDFNTFDSDGIPEDIETGWVAVTPVPVGKRCLAVTHATAGIAGVVPNTTLRSRVLGRPLMKPFPSSLPPHTVLDCILDESWRDNGILHVLDVLKWKGQDIGDCETAFRFWWRDTRLSELPLFPPPTDAQPQTQADSARPQYKFPHPTTFAAIPYHGDTTLANMMSTLIPQTRLTRHIPVAIPIQNDSSGSMELDGEDAAPLVNLQTVSADVKPDGLLLYVSQASYEPGTSPLSNWIPIRPYAEGRHQDGGMSGVPSIDDANTEGPLALFERLMKRRSLQGQSASSESQAVIMDME